MSRICQRCLLLDEPEYASILKSRLHRHDIVRVTSVGVLLAGWQDEELSIGATAQERCEELATDRTMLAVKTFSVELSREAFAIGLELWRN